MKALFGVSLLLLASRPLVAVELGSTYDQVINERGSPRGKMGAGGFVILTYSDTTIRLINNRVVKISGPPPRISVVPAPKPKPKPKPVPAWTSDLDEAISQAREKNRHVLLFFTGAGWGSRGEQLESEIIATPEFVQYAHDNLVLVKMDFPRVAPASKEKGAAAPASASMAASKDGNESQNDDHPVVYVLDSEGRPAGALGYPEGGPNSFIDSIKKL